MVDTVDVSLSLTLHSSLAHKVRLVTCKITPYFAVSLVAPLLGPVLEYRLT